MSLKYTLERFRWIKVLFSPFKPFKVSFYAGKTQVGVPYFYPRKWVKYNNQDIQKAIEEYKANKNKVQVSDGQLYEMYYNYNKAVPIKVGFDWCSLGWKTKWTDTDFRHEWNPVFTFVFFGYQIALTVYSPHRSHYWEAWLYYEYATDKTKSKRERIEQCIKEHNQTWTVSGGEIDYYELILKPKYLK
jgi:hypothetical protein